MLKTRPAILFTVALLFLLSGTIVAYPAQYLIVSAQYGNKRRHIDVTDRLKQMARSNNRYKVDYKTFGDPAPGQAKSLRIYARGPHGHVHMFEYRDGSVIDGSMFKGWGTGQWAGPNDRWNGNWDAPR
ncbi:MAG: hypothetical protein WBW53_04770 [Terriglobales bacterium]